MDRFDDYILSTIFDFSGPSAFKVFSCCKRFQSFKADFTRRNTQMVIKRIGTYGKCHRVDGPVIEYVSGSKFWYKNKPRGNFETTMFQN